MRRLLVLLAVPLVAATPPCECVAQGSWTGAGPVAVSWGDDGAPATTMTGAEPSRLLFATVLWTDGQRLVAIECAQWSPEDPQAVTAWVWLEDLDDTRCPASPAQPAALHRADGHVVVEGLPSLVGAGHGDAPQCIFVQVTVAGETYGDLPQEWPAQPSDCPQLAQVTCSGACQDGIVPAPAWAILVGAGGIVLLRRSRR